MTPRSVEAPAKRKPPDYPTLAQLHPMGITDHLHNVVWIIDLLHWEYRTKEDTEREQVCTNERVHT